MSSISSIWSGPSKNRRVDPKTATNFADLRLRRLRRRSEVPGRRGQRAPGGKAPPSAGGANFCRGLGVEVGANLPTSLLLKLGPPVVPFGAPFLVGVPLIKYTPSGGVLFPLVWRVHAPFSMTCDRNRTHAPKGAQAQPNGKNTRSLYPWRSTGKNSRSSANGKDTR